MRHRVLLLICLATSLICAWKALALSDESGFPLGYDAVQAAPGSHYVVFENAFVRVLQVTVPPPGKTEPMHAIETVDDPRPATAPPLLRIELKTPK